MIGKFLFLGTGGSAGVPVIGCKCNVCLSSSHQRLRSSGLLKLASLFFLIDAGPDFRQQALRYGVDHIDALLLTHTHFDHIAGIDDLRIFYLRQKKPFPCLLSQPSLDDLKLRYFYLFRPLEQTVSLSARFDMTVLKESSGEIDFLGVKIGYFSYLQGTMKVTGFRVGNFAYVSDIKEYDDSIFSALEGVEKLVVSALFEETSPIHFSLDDAIEFSKRVGAAHTYITHISHRMDPKIVSSKLPHNVELATDGMEIAFEY